MKSYPLFPALALLGLAPTLAHAQWQTTTYALKGGWNSIFLTGDAKQDTIDNLLPDAQEVWRWNPNPTQVQFTKSPLIPSAGTPEWSVWKRGLPLESTFSQLSGQTAYLVKCAGPATTTYSAQLKQSPLPPSNSWVRNGANLLGFPSRLTATYPAFSNYFATFPLATAANTKIFKYVGGDLGPGNPLQVFSSSAERLDRTQAYWFSAEVVGNFYAPMEISLSTNNGLAFGRTGSIITARVRNRTGAPVTLTMTPVNSEPAPLSQLGITGPVPLTRRTFNTTTVAWVETPITAPVQEVIGPQTAVELSFGIDRGSMSAAAANAFFASFLRLTDSENLFDISIPATATKASLAGLWVGDIALKKAGFPALASGVGATAREYPLRTLLHISDGGTARLLSKVFIGQLAAGSNELGLCTSETLLKQDAKGTARLLVAAHMPLDKVITAGSGSAAIGSLLVRNIDVPFDDPTNPFVHQYHPDHDNKNPRGASLAAGVESYNIRRYCAFTFTAAPPQGSSTVSGWGSSVIGGTYDEVINGVHRMDVTVSGTFELRRVSELGSLQTP